jgi:hypothetical protein
MKISIQMERYGENGWQWELTGSDPITGEPIIDKGRTNRQGDGLFEINGRQVRGTCQYQLPSDRRAAYNKIRRDFVRDHSYPY